MQLVIVVLLLFMVVLVQPVTGHGPPSYDQLLRENSQLSAINRKLSWKIRRLSEKECKYNGKTYTNRDVFYDDCNTCVCNYGTVACTKETCNKDCTYSGELYAHGSTFTSESGCYTCSCNNGCVECTTKLCLVNPLEKAHATQSTINDNLRAPSLAIDGDYSTMMTTSFPPDEANPWWNVELRCEQTIEAVRLWSRDDGFPNSLNDLVISVDGQFCGNFSSPTPPGTGVDVLVTCETPITGRNVRVTKETEITLTMAEVELVTTVC